MALDNIVVEGARPRDFCARDLVREAPAVKPETKCQEVFELLVEQPDWPCLAVVDAENHVLGLIDRATLLATFGQQFGRSVYERRPVSRLMNKEPLIVTVDTKLDEISRRIGADHAEALVSGFLVTENDRYAGIGLAVDLVSGQAEQAYRRSIELEKANRKAQAASEAKSSFLATMSHEIRTPLNGVIGNLELLRFTDLNQEQSDLIQNAEVSAQTLLGIIGDILDFSKIEAGKIEIESIDTSPAQILSEVEALLISRATQKGIEIKTFVGPRMPKKVKSDPFRLRQVLMNFVSNAIKFTEQGGIYLNLHRMESREDGRVDIRFDVVDTGLGFDPSKAGSLFDAFTQEDSSTTRKFGGTGLGLAICKRISEMMGGEVGAIGCPEHGATFWCRIPVEVVEDAEAAEAPNMDGVSVLFVCNPGSTDSYVSRVREIGGNVESICSMAKAVEATRAANQKGKPYDVIVVEETLQDGDAFQFAEAITGLPGARIMLSDSGVPEAVNRAFRSGYLQPLRKPIAQNDLVHVLARAAGRLKSDETKQAKSIDITQQIRYLKARADQAPVLVIDDTPMNRTVAKRQLKKLGIACEEAENGQVALDMAMEKHYCLLLVDVSMPVMDGYEFTQQWRDWEMIKNIRLPVVAMTGNAMEQDRQRCLDAGMDDFLTKPVMIERLADVLMRWLVDPEVSLPEEAPQIEESQAMGDNKAPEAVEAAGQEPAHADAGAEAIATETGAEAEAEAALGSPILALSDPLPALEPVPSPQHVATGTGSEAEPPIDMEMLGDLLGEDDPSALKEILEFFQESFLPLLDQIDETIAAQDRTAVRNAAHAAKSAARNASTTLLGTQMADLEAMAKDGDWEAITTLAAAARIEFGRVEAFIANL